LWQKLYRAGAPLLAGASLTEAAHAAGFVDSAHYSRAFQTAYGRCPTDMFRIRRTVVFYDNAFRSETVARQYSAKAEQISAIPEAAVSPRRWFTASGTF
jgi:AraC-like DNA-binding protein